MKKSRNARYYRLYLYGHVVGYKAVGVNSVTYSRTGRLPFSVLPIGHDDAVRIDSLPGDHVGDVIPHSSAIRTVRLPSRRGLKKI